LPISWLKQQQGVQIIVAHDADRAGEEMAWKVALELPVVTRAIPSGGKDWNEQLLGDRLSLSHATFLDFSQWKQVAQALGRTDTYVDWVVTVTEAMTAQQPLPETVVLAMQQDFNNYKQMSRQLWQWHRAAKTLNETDAYLKRIAEVGIAFHHPIQPSPLSAKTLATMQQDREKLAYMSRYRELLHKVCKSSDLAISSTEEIDVAVALTAYKESFTPKEVGRIIAQSDRVKAWKKSMSETDFRFKATEYVREVCERSLKLHSTEQQQKVQLHRSKKCSQDIEL
jgi:DNA primase